MNFSPQDISLITNNYLVLMKFLLLTIALFGIKFVVHKIEKN